VRSARELDLDLEVGEADADLTAEDVETEE